MSVYDKIKSLQPSRSMFNLSHEKKFDCDMGQLIPILCKSMVPGDVFKIGNEIVARTQPQMAPTLHEINVHTYYFFVPYRILFGEDVTDDGHIVDYQIHDHDFELFMTGGRTGNDTSVALPRWIPTGDAIVNDNWDQVTPDAEADPPVTSNLNDVNVTTTDNGVYSLWDYFGLPTGVIPADAYPLDFMRRAYNLAFNYYFRDENLMDWVSITNSKVLNACWKKDYFTSALPFAQRGTAPGMPIQVNGSAVFGDGLLNQVFGTTSTVNVNFGDPATYSTTMGLAYFIPGEYVSQDGVLIGDFGEGDGTEASGSQFPLQVNGSDIRANSSTLNALNNNNSLRTAITSFDVNDLRLAFQIQKWMERNMRAGYRYNEFLLSHFGVAPRDERLQKPEFIGGSKSPLIVSEVLQTSESSSGSPQGHLAGHGLTASSNYIAKYHAVEYGLVLGLMCIKPKSTYQQGIDREWLYRSKYDFYFPEFAHLGEQAVEEAELYAQESGNVDAYGEPVLFGYQGRYNELRSAHSVVCGGLRSTFDYWHLGRKFGSPPLLNEDFLKMRPSKRIFAVMDEPGFIVNVGNIITAYRPLPKYAEPGLIDHS